MVKHRESGNKKKQIRKKKNKWKNKKVQNALFTLQLYTDT